MRLLKAECDYTYAVSRIKAMENRMVDSTILQQMADADGFDSAWKLLMETCYGQWVAETGASSYDKLLEAELVYLYNELRKFVPDPSIVSLFQIPYDFHNMKVVLKSLFAQRGGGESRWDLLVSMGSYPADEMILAIESEDYRLLPYQLHRVIPSCVMIWEQTKNILEIENILDRHMSVSYTHLDVYKRQTFLLGLAMYILVRAGMLSPVFSSPSAIISLVGAGILIATQGREKKNIFSKLFSGVMSLYSITSYLGDVLSYSRLLALGLATSAIAMIINTLTMQLFSIPYKMCIRDSFDVEHG